MVKIVKIDDTQQNNDVLDSLLNQTHESETKSNLEILKELFVEDEIRTKTELPINAVILVNQKQAIARLLYWDSLQMVLSDFMVLMVSRDRKGRAEFVDAFKSERQVEQPKGFLTNLKEKLI